MKIEIEVATFITFSFLILGMMLGAIVKCPPRFCEKQEALIFGTPQAIIPPKIILQDKNGFTRVYEIPLEEIPVSCYGLWGAALEQRLTQLRNSQACSNEKIVCNEQECKKNNPAEALKE